MKKFKVVVTVEVEVSAEGEDAAAEKAETTVQRLLDAHGKRLGAVVGADYGEVSEVTVSRPKGIVVSYPTAGYGVR